MCFLTASSCNNTFSKGVLIFCPLNIKVYVIYKSCPAQRIGLYLLFYELAFLGDWSIRCCVSTICVLFLYPWTYVIENSTKFFFFIPTWVLSLFYHEWKWKEKVRFYYLCLILCLTEELISASWKVTFLHPDHVSILPCYCWETSQSYYCTNAV